MDDFAEIRAQVADIIRLHAAVTVHCDGEDGHDYELDNAEELAAMIVALPDIDSGLRFDPLDYMADDGP